MAVAIQEDVSGRVWTVKLFLAGGQLGKRWDNVPLATPHRLLSYYGVEVNPKKHMDGREQEEFWMFVKQGLLKCRSS